MKNLIKQILVESKHQKTLDYIKHKNFSGVKEVLIFLIDSGFDLEEIKEITNSLFDNYKDFTKDIPNIDAIREVVDNWGTTNTTKKKDDLIYILTHPDEWTDDQIIWDKHGFSYFWDDLVNQFVIVGEELIYIKE
jgi:hypothetical protein